MGDHRLASGCSPNIWPTRVAPRKTGPTATGDCGRARFCRWRTILAYRSQQTDRSPSSKSQLGQTGNTISMGSPDGSKHLVFLSSMVQPQSRQCCAISRESVSRRRRIDFSEVICHLLAPPLLQFEEIQSLLMSNKQGLVSDRHAHSGSGKDVRDCHGQK